MEVINGYVCKTCCDVELAKKHINPADPQDDVHNPKSPNYGKPEDPQHPGKPAPPSQTPAVTFGGTLLQVQAAAKPGDPAPTVSSTHKPYVPGALTSVTA